MLAAYDNASKEQQTVKVFCRHLVPTTKVNEMKRLPFFLYLQARSVLRTVNNINRTTNALDRGDLASLVVSPRCLDGSK